MALTYKNLPKITFPIYPIDIDNLEIKDGLILLHGKVVDDLNMKGSSLGIRRLQSPFNDRLQPLRKGVANVVGIIKNKYKNFIDYEGTLFRYQKTKFCEVKYLRIDKIELKGSASLLLVEGVKRPFTIPRPPEQGQFWALVLHLDGLPWMIYGYSSIKELDFIRKI